MACGPSYRSGASGFDLTGGTSFTVTFGFE